MGYWEIPKLWDKEPCFILGGGPSLAKAPIGKLFERNVVAVNNAYLRCPWAIAVYFQDCKWYHEALDAYTVTTHREALREFKGFKVTTCLNSEEPDGSVKILLRGGRLGLSLERDRVNGNNSGYGAIDLAMKFGASPIILLGFDMRMVNGKHNYHDGHRRAVGSGVYANQFIPALRTIPKAVKKLDLGVEIINCTPDSELDCFPMGRIEDYL